MSVLKNIFKKSKSIFQNQELYKNVFFFLPHTCTMESQTLTQKFYGG